MLYNKQAVQENLRNRAGKRVFFLGKGDRLTSEAKDFLLSERIEILPAEQAKPERYALLTGGYMESKPEHWTHLNGEFLVPKTHPRIRFRGAMDTLEGELLLCGLVCSKTEQLEQVLALSRNLVRWEVLDEPVKEEGLCGMTMDQLRQRSHRPQDFYGQPHFMPSIADGAEILQLNRARCAARAAELAAAEAFTDREGNLTREDILRALNRISSMLYLMMIESKVKN